MARRTTGQGCSFMRDMSMEPEGRQGYRAKVRRSHVATPIPYRDEHRSRSPDLVHARLQLSSNEQLAHCMA
jgi:hypothetical protein